MFPFPISEAIVPTPGIFIARFPIACTNFFISSAYFAIRSGFLQRADQSCRRSYGLSLPDSKQKRVRKADKPAPQRKKYSAGIQSGSEPFSVHRIPLSPCCFQINEIAGIPPDPFAAIPDMSHHCAVPIAERIVLSNGLTDGIEIFDRKSFLAVLCHPIRHDICGIPI